VAESSFWFQDGQKIAGTFLIVPARVWEKPQRAICVEAQASSVRGRAASTGLSKYCRSVAAKSHPAGAGSSFPSDASGAWSKFQDSNQIPNHDDETLRFYRLAFS
jgi:long-subunit acyl-CoA synthetase (AMP-forming)